MAPTSGQRASAPPGPDTVIMTAARSWRRARDHGQAVQPCLSRALAAYDRTMLAPVLDSLLTFYELALGRPIRPGYAAPSADELGLLALLEGFGECPRLDGDEAAASVLGCAVCSARIMLAIAAGEARRAAC